MLFGKCAQSATMKFLVQGYNYMIVIHINELARENTCHLVQITNYASSGKEPQ